MEGWCLTGETLHLQAGDQSEIQTVDESVDITPQPQVSVVVMEQSTGKVKAIVIPAGLIRENLFQY